MNNKFSLIFEEIKKLDRDKTKVFSMLSHFGVSLDEGVVNPENQAIYTLFEMARAQNNPEAAIALIKAGFNPNLDLTDGTSLSALTLALDLALEGDTAWLEVALLLIERNANLALTQNGNWPALQAVDLAHSTRNYDVLRAMINKNPACIRLVGTSSPYSLLGRAVAVRDINLIEFLLSHGADPQSSSVKHDMTVMAFVNAQLEVEELRSFYQPVYDVLLKHNAH